MTGKTLCEVFMSEIMTAGDTTMKRVTMTVAEATEWVYDQDEASGEIDETKLEAAFAVLHGRPANADDRDAGLWNLCCAATPNCGTRPEAESKPKTAYRVYRAPEGAGLSYCSEHDTREAAEAAADKEPEGLHSSMWETARAAGMPDGLRAPEGGGIEDDKALSWHGKQGWHCVVPVTYPAA